MISGKSFVHSPTALAASLLLILPLPAFAQNAPSADEEIETTLGETQGQIIVTARRRVEDVQDVPASMAVVGGDLLTQTRAVNLSQVTQLVPALNYSSPNPRNTAFTIRGLGSSVVAISQANDGLEPGVGFYVDQVYHARPATAAFDFTDIDQIEVLRGPQGTVFGKNTTAGAIHITTKAPRFEFGADEEISIGQQGLRQAKASITGPLIGDVLAARLSGSITRRDGVLRNVVTGRLQNNVHNDAIRGQLLFKPSDAFSFRLIGDWSNFKNECCTQVYVRVAPTLRPLAQQYTALTAGQNYRPPSLNPYDRLTDIDAPLGVDTNEGGVSGIAEWTQGNSVITSVSAWRFWNWDAANDRDYTGLPIQLTQHIPSRQDQYSQELRIASKKPGKIEYVAGLYYFHQKIVGHPISIYGPLATYWLLPAGRPANLLDGYQTGGTTDFRTDSYGVFGEVTWHPLPRLAVTGGIRYTYEEKDGLYDVTASGGLTTGLTAALINDKNSILRTQKYAAHIGEGSPSGRVNLSYHFSDDIMAYASFARGEKSGGINVSGLPTYPTGVPGQVAGSPILSTAVVRPEKNTTWEGGIKTSLFDKRLTFNINGYYTRVTDFQANVVDFLAPAALRSFLANIPEVTVKGVEFDAALNLTSHFSLRASGAYEDGRYTSYPNGPCPLELVGGSLTKCDLSGKPLSGLPKWSGSLGGEYAVPITRGEFYVRADANAKTSIFGDSADSQYTIIKGYAQVNASIGFRAVKGWEIALFARNLFDKNYLQNVTIQAGNSGLIVGTPNDPQIFGITLRARQ
jgi:iron complex outermembrane recepter protein